MGQAGGRWLDLAAIELTQGHALWLPNGIEYAHNREYLALAERAAAAQRGLYDPDSCGAGPDQDVPLASRSTGTPTATTSGNLNGEWIDVHNLGPRRAPPRRLVAARLVAAHRPRPACRATVFPTGAAIPPGGTLRLRGGCGSDSRAPSCTGA